MSSTVSLGLIRAVFTSAHAAALTKGVSTHDPARDFVAQLVSKTQDDELITKLVRAALPEHYFGNTMEEVPAMIAGAREKGYGSLRDAERAYDPGEEGPIALGFTREGHFALLDQVRQIIVLQLSTQLMSHQNLAGLAPIGFWNRAFPGEGKFNAYGAALALMDACRIAGPFLPNQVRGRGVWLEGARVVLNFGNALPSGLKHRYLCFEPIPIQTAESFETARLLRWLQHFKWRNPKDAKLFLGWLAVAPICGVLSWRPHCFLYGPPRCGKTTIHTMAAKLLTPLVISTDGQSTEAGIRQTLGPDSLPVMIDEFESDQSGYGLKGVLRLARSASSADNPVLKGTPEGKAMQFSLRTTFFFAAINPRGMTAADESRILRFELLMHANDEGVARHLVAEEQFFAKRGPEWCGYMIARAHLIQPTIDAFAKAMPGIDLRHRTNITTLMAGAFVALEGRIPSEVEATQWAEDFTETVTVHAESLERDDAMEALQHLLSHEVDGDTLGHWLGQIANGSAGSAYLPQPPTEPVAHVVLRLMGMRLVKGGDRAGWYIQNSSPGVERAFQGTRWADGAWMSALRKLPEAQVAKTYFSGTGAQHRAVLLPLRYLEQEAEPPYRF